jgi:dTDP-4-dehydrorhamnose reductase
MQAMRVVLTGASGQLGPYVLERLIAAGYDVDAWSGTDPGERSGVRLRPVDLTDRGATLTALTSADPAVVIHAAAVSTIDEVRRHPEQAVAVNVKATGHLADWCARLGRRLLHTSTDLVFDGTRGMYREGDPAEPLVLYGRTKLRGEAEALKAPGAAVARLSLMYGPARGGRPSYFDRTLAALRRGESQTFFEDEFRTPLDYPTAAEALVRLTESDFQGLIHVGGPERLSRYDLARRTAEALGFDAALIRANRQRDATFPDPRPADVSLDSTRLVTLFTDLRRPPVEEAVASMIG